MSARGYMYYRRSTFSKQFENSQILSDAILLNHHSKSEKNSSQTKIPVIGKKVSTFLCFWWMGMIGQVEAKLQMDERKNKW